MDVEKLAEILCLKKKTRNMKTIIQKIHESKKHLNKKL